MGQGMTIEIPPMKIVSDNDRLIPVIDRVRYNALRVVTSGVYKRCKESLIKIIQAQIPATWEPSDDIVLELFVHTYKDATNILKILCDALEGAGVVKNDRHITTLFVCKYPVKRGQPDVVKMRIVNLEG